MYLLEPLQQLEVVPHSPHVVDHEHADQVQGGSPAGLVRLKLLVQRVPQHLLARRLNVLLQLRGLPLFWDLDNPWIMEVRYSMNNGEYLDYQTVACAGFACAVKILPKAWRNNIWKNFCNFFRQKFAVRYAPIKSATNFGFRPSRMNSITLCLGEAVIGSVRMGAEG